MDDEPLSKVKAFARSVPMRDLSQQVAGTRSLSGFVERQRQSQYLQHLYQCGLTPEEVSLKLHSEGVEISGVARAKSGARVHVDPRVHRQRLEEIERKIAVKEKEKELEQPPLCPHPAAEKVNRRRGEAGESLLRETQDDDCSDHLPVRGRRGFTHPDDPINHLDRISAELFESRARKRRKSSDDGEGDGDAGSSAEGARRGGLPTAPLIEGATVSGLLDESDVVGETLADGPEETAGTDPPSCCVAQRPRGNTDSHPDSGQPAEGPGASPGSIQSRDTAARSPQQHFPEEKTSGSSGGRTESDRLAGGPPRVLQGSIEPIPEQVIQQTKLSLEEIRRLPRFSSYQPGEPSNVLYIKNLSAKVTERDLVALFIRFQERTGPPIVFKLLSGRMRGQAFVTFGSEVDAGRALELANGFLLWGKPLIIEYGKQRKT